MRHGTAIFIATLLFLLPAVSGCTEDVKQPAVAGSFYPADPKVLGATVDAFLAAAGDQPGGNGRLIALIAPHAGYQFSGQVAAYSYRHIRERDVETVILIGVSHYESFSGASVYTQGSMATPLGNVEINTEMARALLDDKSQVVFNPDVYAREHSLEVQLPFLQRTRQKVRIVPILLGAPTQASFSYLLEKLTEIMRTHPETIIIASTDLSHYHDYRTAKKMDGKILDAVGRMSVEDAERVLRSGEGEMCGSFAVLLTMAAARNLGATSGRVFHYANSGDVTGKKDSVVGYAAVGLYRSGLTENEKRELLALAKRTIREYVNTGRAPEPKGTDSRLLANGATFVTINRSGMLRGCIGNIQPVMSLYESVVSNAVSACSRDPRFRPMTKEDLKDMEVEVTVLSPLEPLVDVKDIRIGTHGLFIVKGDASGILLPQVAVEYGWDARTFLEEVSVKAGLPKDAWKDTDAKLYYYTAEIIRD